MTDPRFNSADLCNIELEAAVARLGLQNTLAVSGRSEGSKDLALTFSIGGVSHTLTYWDAWEMEEARDIFEANFPTV